MITIPLMADPATLQRLKQNWESVQNDVHEATRRSGRDPSSVTIIGVSKYVGSETTAALIQAGCHDLGESRPQVLWQKAESLSLNHDLRWHLIGHLQRNKIRRLLREQPIIHSVDSQRLLAALATESVAQNQQVSVLLEVNISGDDAKTGFAIDDMVSVIDQIPTAGVRVEGLMAMAGWGTDPQEARRQFARLRELREQLTTEPGLPLRELSMGMSGDFREAIAEGATMVRIGSRLFEGVSERS
jgi:pyridoxal phosphate enzyme (YggS family)